MSLQDLNRDVTQDISEELMFGATRYRPAARSLGKGKKRASFGFPINLRQLFSKPKFPHTMMLEEILGDAE